MKLYKFKWNKNVRLWTIYKKEINADGVAVYKAVGFTEKVGMSIDAICEAHKRLMQAH